MKQTPRPPYLNKGFPPRSAWAMWKGVEIEGRWQGIPTLFVRDANEGAICIAVLADRSIGHILIGTAMIAKLLNMASSADDQPALLEVQQTDDHLEFYCRLLWDKLGQSFPITLEVTQEQLEIISAPILLQRCHIFVCLPASSDILAKLKPSDTVRLDYGILCTSTAARHHFVDTTPQDYEDADERIL